MECQIINKIRNIAAFTAMVAITGLLTGCYIDNEEDLYPQTGGCDTANVTYTLSIAPLMADKCNSCHGGNSPEAGLKTDNYNDLKTLAGDGRLQGTVNHLSGYSPMPKNKPKLSDCNLAKIKTWIDNGALNN
ncbi:MAG: hypothetical protein JXA03_00785 [Bacteroidales bacterium]|nr:hypothetical protein [Bacteroidales bacterium]